MKTFSIRILLPNVLTIIGLCLGITAIRHAIEQNYQQAIIFITFASILDGMDGRIARIIKGTSKFGAELDSLSDFVSFGIAPAIITYSWILKNIPNYGWVITLLFIISSCLRLARFNVDSRDNKKESWKLNFFSGVPTPFAAGLMLLPLILHYSKFEYISDMKSFSIIIALTTSFLMISKIPTYALKNIRLSKPALILFFLGIVAFFSMLYLNTFETLATVLFLYILSIPISFAHYLYIKKKKGIKNNKNKSIISDEIL